jgi:glycosyltransferase involved in cell wall biosynthesis
MIRVLILVPELPLNIDNIKGGVHAASINLIKGFLLLKINVRVISFTRAVNEKIIYKISSKIEIVYLPEGPFKYHSFNYLFIVPRKLKSQIKEFNPDLIHFEVGNTFMFSKILGLYKKKYLLTIHGMSYEEGRIKYKWKDKFIWFFNAFIQDIMYPKNVIHLSHYSQNKFSRFKETHSVIIPNAVNEIYFKIPLKNNTQNKLLYIGLIDTNKNLIFLLKQLAYLNKHNFNFTLEIVGDFVSLDYKNIIMEFIQNNNLFELVKFRGWITQTGLISILSESDILVVSSMHESLPMVISESMASGKVVVCSNVGGIPEMITDKITGFLFSLENEHLFLEILKLLYNNKNLCQEIGKNAKRYSFENFRSVCVAEKTFDFYNKIIYDSI